MGKLVKTTKLSSVLTQVRREEILSKERSYKLLGVRWYGKGVFIREEKKGREIKAQKLYRVKTGDFIYNRLFAWKSSFAMITSEFSDCFVSNEFPVFNLKDNSIDLEYLLRFILLPQNIDAVNRVSGGMSSVSRKRFKEVDFKNFEIPCLSANQQKRLVSYISTIESNLNLIENETESQSAYLSKLRQAILQEAIEGKLTADWRKKHPVKKGDPNTDAAALLEQIKAEKQNLIAAGKLKKQKPLAPIKLEEIPFELLKRWVWCRTSDVCLHIVDCPHSTPKFLSHGRKCIDTTCINMSGHILESKVRKVSEETFIERNVRLVPAAGDIIYSREGIVGQAIIIPPDYPVCLGQRVMLFRPHPEISSAFFRRLVTSKFFLDKMLERHRGMGAKHVNMRDLREILIPLPPLAEQQAIVERVEHLLAMVDEMEQQVKTRQQQAEQLMQSVLREAFEG